MKAFLSGLIPLLACMGIFVWRIFQAVRPSPIKSPVGEDSQEMLSSGLGVAFFFSLVLTLAGFAFWIITTRALRSHQ